MGKGSTRRPGNEELLEKNWPFPPRRKEPYRPPPLEPPRPVEEPTGDCKK
jgi:hypothetical protein